jgi:hypothetical protein
MAVQTITTTASEDTRLGAAFGDLLQVRNGSGLPRSATAAEIKAAQIAWATAIVVAYEDKVAKAALVPASPIAPT